MARIRRCFMFALVGLSFLLTGTQSLYGKQNTVTTVSSSPNPSSVGGTVTFTATVTSQQSGQSNQHCPDGVVQFQINGANYGSPVQVTPGGTNCSTPGAIAIGIASITVSFPTAGSYPVVAIYGGDHDFESSSSSAYTQVVGNPSPIRTTTDVVSSGSPSVVGQSVTFTAGVEPAQWGFGVPTGTVTFAAGGTTLFIGKLNSEGWVEFTTSSLPAGSLTITATYSGDTTYSGSAGSMVQTVMVPSKTPTTLALDAAPTSITVGQTVWLTASVTPAVYVAGAPTGTVTFTSGSVTITGTLADGWVTVTTSALALGSDTITATYSGDANYGTSSATATVLVNSPRVIPTSTSLVASPPTSVLGEGVWFTAGVTPTMWGPVAPTGTVTLTLTDAQGNHSTLFSGALPAAGWVGFTSISLPLGANSVTATYSGDVNYGGSSATVTVQVNPGAGKTATSVALVASPPTSQLGDQVWFTATVTPNQWTSGPPTGTVTVTLTDAHGNASTLFSGALPPAGWVDFSTNSLPLGANSITASYSGDAHYSSSSGTATEQVNPASGKINTSVALVAAPTTTMFGQPVWLTATVTPNQYTYGSPTGTMTFTSGNITISGNLTGGPSDDWVTVSTSALPAGSNTITATYSGDSHYNSSSATVTEIVNPLDIGTTIALVTGPNPSILGDPVTITATVTPSVWGFGTPAGTVTVTSGSVTLSGTLNAGWVTFLTSALPQGNNTITATYSGNSTFKGSTATVTQIVSLPATP